MTEKEKLLAGLPCVIGGGDKELGELIKQEKQNLYEFNTTNPNNGKRLGELTDALIGKTDRTGGQYPNILQPFYCLYGFNIEIGKWFGANHHCTILAVAKVTIGNRVVLGPNVTITTSGHPIHPNIRQYGYGRPITIGNDVWIGANAVILPGIHIGNNVVIGAGSIVTKDIPDNVVAVGNPCRVLRNITEEDKKYYYKDRMLTEEEYHQLFD